MMNFLRIALLSQAALVSKAQSIDPQIYAKIFEVNQPSWEYLGRKIAELQLPDGAKMLDIGAGPGEPTTTILAANPGLQVTCTDSQAPMNEKAKIRTAKKLGSAVSEKITFEVADVADLANYSLNTFDVVTGAFVLMFVDVGKALKEAERVLKPGGTAFFSVWNKMDFYEKFREVVDDSWKDLGAPHKAPAFKINPLALAQRSDKIEFNTKGDLAKIVASETSLQLASFEDLTYDFPMGSMQNMCDATRIFSNDIVPGMVPELKKMMLHMDMTEEKYYTKLCDELSEELREEYPHWKKGGSTKGSGRRRTEGETWKFGQGEARIYKLQKKEDRKRKKKGTAEEL